MADAHLDPSIAEDADTGAGTREAVPVILVKKASGAPDLGTPSDPVRTDPTGTTAQPVTNDGSTLSVDDGAGSLTVDGTVTVQDGGNVISVDDAGTTISIDDGAGSITVDGPLTDTQLRASAVPVGDGEGSITVDNTFNNGATWDNAKNVADTTNKGELALLATPNFGGEATGSTTDSFVTAVILRNTGGKVRIKVSNTGGTNDLDYRIYGGTSSGTTDDALIASTTVQENANSTKDLFFRAAYERVLVQVKSTVGGAPTNYKIEWAANIGPLDYESATVGNARVGIFQGTGQASVTSGALHVDAVKAPQRADAYTYQELSLTSARAAPGSEIQSGGSSIAGEWLYILVNDAPNDAVKLRFDSSSNDGIVLDNLLRGDVLFLPVKHTKIFVENTAQSGKILRFVSGRKS